MGIKTFLPHLPGGGPHEYHISLCELREKAQLTDQVIFPLDAAGAIWDFAAKHAWDYVRGNHTPALIEWAQFLVYLRSICNWQLVVIFDGMENPDKEPDIQIFCTTGWSLCLFAVIYSFFASALPLEVPVIAEAYGETSCGCIMTLFAIFDVSCFPGSCK